MKTTVVSTPFPSVRTAAVTLGVGETRVQGLTGLMHAIRIGRDVSSVRSLETFRAKSKAYYRKAKVKKTVRSSKRRGVGKRTGGK